MITPAGSVDVVMERGDDGERLEEPHPASRAIIQKAIARTASLRRCIFESLR